jgi:LuxR family maltose regulon positive regulatory protein
MANAPTPGSGTNAASSRLPLLTTKLYLPSPRPQLVPRPRLLTRLNEGLSHKLILISAPAGFGKTTVLSEWLHQLKDEGGRMKDEERIFHPSSFILHPSRVAWLSLDEGDNDPTRFWIYFISALQLLQSNLGQNALNLLQSPQPPSFELILTMLLNELATFPNDFALILDDYHLIENPAIHTATTFLLDHLLPRMHLIITARADPPLPLSRLRARGQLTELRAADLRFTPEEATAFLNEGMGLPLTAADIAALEERTEGWIAGLQLAALAMRDRTDLSGFVSAFTGSNRFIVDYLAAEVLARQPAHLQTFLLQTAILERLCGPLCDALLGVEEAAPSSSSQLPVAASQQMSATPSYSQILLEELERSNLFLMPLDSDRHWYRYHHLFAEVLRVRLISGATAEMVATLHRRASAWFEQGGWVAEAIEHALLGQDGARAARLVEVHGESMRMRGELATLRRWLEALPEEAIRARPKLGLNHAFLLVVTDSFAEAEQRLLEVEQVLQAEPVGDGVAHMALVGQAAAIRTIVSFMLGYSGDVILAAAQQALDRLSRREVHWRAHVVAVLGATYYYSNGDVAAADHTLMEAIRLGEEAGDVFTVMLSLWHQSSMYRTQGRLRQAEATCQRLLQYAVEPDWRGQPAVGYARLARSWVRYEHNDLEATLEDVIEGWQSVKGYTLKRISLDGYVMLARLKQVQGDETEARELMQQAMQIVHRDKLKQTFVPVAAWQARLWLAQGHHNAAAQWAQEIEPTLRDELSPALEFEHLTLVRIQLAQNRLNEAVQLLTLLLAAAETAGRMGRVIEIRLLQALLASAQGNVEQALPILQQALTLAEPEGYIRIFVDEGEPMAQLLARMNSLPGAGDEGGRMNDYIHKLLAAFEARGQGSQRAEEKSDPSPLLPHSSAPLLVDPLSQREIELLRLVAAGQSNQEIAQELFLAIGTVKKHLNNIFGKLGVGNRTQAIARARELDVL